MAAKLLKKSPFNKVTPFNRGSGQITVSFNASDQEPATIQIYEDIGKDPWTGEGFSDKDFADALEDIPRNKPIDVRLNSAGGSVWQGQAIKTRFDEWPARKTVSIDGMAASVASWFMLSADEVRAPKHAQMFVHPAWAFVAGYADDLNKVASDLEKTSKQIAGIYARKTGMSVSDCMDLMTAETLMTAEEAHEMGFIDKLTDDDPIDNFTEEQIRNMKAKLADMRNSISALKSGATNNDLKNQQDEMNRKAMEALLNKWGVKFDNKATDDQLMALIEKGPPAKKNAVKYKEGDDGEHADDCDCSDCNKKNKKRESDDEDNALNRAINAAKRAEAAALAMENQAKAAIRVGVTNRVKQAIEDSKLPAAQMDEWIEDALAAKDTDKFLNRLEALEPRRPGLDVAGYNLTIGETSSVEELNKMIETLKEPERFHSKNRTTPDDMERLIIGRNCKEISKNLNKLKKFNAKGEMVGPLREMWDAWSVSSPRNANTMTADLLRQVILSEIMRAFRREFATLSLFAHTYQNVPLEGSDYVKVPYYPLDTVASTEFVYANGYVVSANAQTLSKSIFVGGIGNGVATSGSGRKYKPLQFTAYEVRRQPWLNIAQLTVMAGEQLAVDVRGDILGTQIQAANFGNAIWTGLAGGFDHTVVTQYLLNAAIKAFWPKAMRHCVLAPDYYTTLLADPNISRFLEAGTDEALRQAIIGSLYGFNEITYDALVPVPTFIRGGDGAVTAGNDLKLAGFIAYPSAILIATAPIMPPPGVLKKLVAYEQVTDDQTGLTFNYQYFGIELSNVDNEIIESTYGSNVGEVAALKRITSSGV